MKLMEVELHLPSTLVTDQCVAFRDKVIGYALADETQQKETRRVVDTYGVETSNGSKPLKSLERTMEYEMNLQTGQSSTTQTVTQTSKAGHIFFLIFLLAVMGVFESGFHYIKLMRKDLFHVHLLQEIDDTQYLSLFELDALFQAARAFAKKLTTTKPFPIPVTMLEMEVALRLFCV